MQTAKGSWCKGARKSACRKETCLEPWFSAAASVSRELGISRDGVGKPRSASAERSMVPSRHRLPAQRDLERDRAPGAAWRSIGYHDPFASPSMREGPPAQERRARSRSDCKKDLQASINGDRPHRGGRAPLNKRSPRVAVLAPLRRDGVLCGPAGRRQQWTLADRVHRIGRVRQNTRGARLPSQPADPEHRFRHSLRQRGRAHDLALRSETVRGAGGAAAQMRSSSSSSGQPHKRIEHAR